MGLCLASTLVLAACGGSPAAPPSPPAAIGQAVTSGDAQVMITKVTTRGSVGIQYAMEKASDGAVLVVVEYTIKNNGAKPLSAFLMPRVTLADPQGVEYEADIAKTGSYAMENDDLNAKVMSDLNPGISTRGAEVFEVAAAQYDPATWVIRVGGKDSLVKLQ
jgi:hypothetical protein